jgi:GNAT superfamily N-acetyltransferase
MTSPSDQFGAKPAVLRCSRCGRFVDWDEARVQVICACRPHLELPPVLVREATDADRRAARELFQRDFGRTKIVAFGEVMDIDQMPALVATMTSSEPSGALAYRLLGDSLHIVALATDPMWQRSGVGGYLVAEAELLARRLTLNRLVVATTNDNLPSLYFYQRRGYRLTDLVPGSIAVHTGQEIAGFAGIPVRDEIRLEKKIRSEAQSLRGGQKVI